MFRLPLKRSRPSGLRRTRLNARRIIGDGDAHGSQGDTEFTVLADEWVHCGPAVPVWAIIGYMPVVAWNTKAAAKAYHVPVEAIEAAVAYHRRNQHLIDHRIG